MRRASFGPMVFMRQHRSGVRTDERKKGAQALKQPSRLNENLAGRRVKGTADAQAVRLSMPIPREHVGHFGLAGAPTQAETVASWYGMEGEKKSRRQILLAATDGAPEQLNIEAASPPEGEFTGPAAELAIVERRTDTALAYEVNELGLRMRGKRLGIRVGLLTDEGLHWWHWAKLEVLSRGPVCCTVRAMGAIPVHFETEADVPDSRDYALYPWLHVHNHVRGEVFARCFANGVVELCLRHINGRFFTEGGDVKGVTPVLGFTAPDPGGWAEEDGIADARRWQLGGVQIDSSDASHLLNEDRPGKTWREGDILVYQPYAGMEAYSGRNRGIRHGDMHLVRACDRTIPKGMARTVRMTASLGDAPPEVAVYVAPEWWYGICEEFASEPILPVHDECDPALRKSEEWLNANVHKDCFDDGGLARYGLNPPGDSPVDMGWEGEAPYAHLLAAYRWGDPRTYDLALRSAYHIADVGTNHALFAVRIHAYETDAQALTMQRILAHFGAYLETGDPYLCETAKSVAETAYWWDRTYYPRRSIGRDAAYVRGLVFLYRYTGDRFYIERTREAIGRIMAVQLPDGSYSDQGGTTGIHGALNLVVKPWMGCIATEPLIDYLGIADDADVTAAALRFADWLLASRVEYEGDLVLTYQVSFDGGTVYPNIMGPTTTLPTKGPWHVDYTAKILGWASPHTGDPQYYRAWHESFVKYGGAMEWDHGASKMLQNVTWLRSKLWGATVGDEGIEINPRPDATGGALSARLSSPLGELPVSADQPGRRVIASSLSPTPS